MGWIKGFVGISLIEYPGEVSAAVFTGGCPFRCPFCHNKELVIDPASLPDFDEEDILARLKKRAGFCDGVVISGGEPLMYPGLEVFIRRLKEMGLLVKLDTNGYFPEQLDRLIQAKLLNFVSMDLKTSVKKYRTAAGVHVDWWRIEHALTLLNKSTVDHEFRTTLVPGLVTLNDIPEMAMILGHEAKWVLQQFRSQCTLDPSYADIIPYSDIEITALLHLAQSLKSNVTARLDFDPAQRQFNQKVVTISA